MARNSSRALVEVQVVGVDRRHDQALQPAAHTTQALTSCSCSGLVAEQAQNASSSSPAAAGSPSSSADQASRAHTAPPGGAAEADDLDPGQPFAPSSRSSTPAVKAVWLPPPWQAIATRIRPVSVIRPMLRQRRFAPLPVGKSPAHQAAAEVCERRGADGGHRDPIPGRLDRMPWARWHWLVVTGSASASRPPASR